MRFGLVLTVLALVAAHAAAAQTGAPPEWQQIVDAVKQEGVVVVAMGPTQVRRDFLVKQWKADHPDIELSLTIAPRSVVAALIAERAFGKFLWDVFCGGPSMPSATRTTR